MLLGKASAKTKRVARCDEGFELTHLHVNLHMNCLAPECVVCDHQLHISEAGFILIGILAAVLFILRWFQVHSGVRNK